MTSSRRESGRIALVVHPSAPEGKQLAARVRRWWEGRGYEIVEVDADAEQALETTVAFAVSLGGDGTMLRTARFAIERRIPVVGVNLGSLGYLTQVEPETMEEAFSHLVRGEFEIEERMVLDVRVERPDGTRSTFFALNDAALERTSVGRTIRLNVAISGQAFHSYVADGILVSTPTGSTAYNFSLRGPVVSPRLRAIIVTPICPHMLFDRSLVLDPGESVRVELPAGPPAVLAVDGMLASPVGPGDAIVAAAAEVTAHLVRFGPQDFHSIVRAKFGLAER